MDIVVTDTASPADQLDASFDIVARQDACDSAIVSLRTDVDEVKSRLDRVSRAAQRPALAADSASPEVKSFVGGYLRTGRTAELKSLTTTAASDGGYAVPREIDAAIARELTAISPIRGIAQVVQTGSSGYRKLVSTGGTASGWVSETAARPEIRRSSPRSPRRPASSTPTRRRARRCSTTRRSISNPGSRARSRWSSPGPKARRS